MPVGFGIIEEQSEVGAGSNSYQFFRASSKRFYSQDLSPPRNGNITVFMP